MSQQTWTFDPWPVDQPASRELDAEVAERVMGRCGHVLKRVADHLECQKCGEAFWGLSFHEGHCAFPSYSIDIAAAMMQVVGEMAVRGWRLLLEAKLLHQKAIRCYSATLERLTTNGDLEQVGVFEAQTAPMAICVAALKAMGVEVEDEAGQGT